MRSLVPALFLAGALALGACSGSRSADDPSETDGDAVAQDGIERRGVRQVEEMLRGQVAGVEVRQSARGLVIRIRQGGGFLTSDEPLFVIDGLPISPGTDGALDGINPEDIASIRVLKNASETAFYGSRGANGVVLITTVRPPPAPPEDAPADSAATDRRR